MAVHILLLRALNALLPLAALTLWLAPQLAPIDGAATVHAARSTTVDAHGAPAAAIDGVMEVEVDRRLDPPSAVAIAAPRAPVAAHGVAEAPDQTTLSRTRAPIYRVRRSGQAHRSAP